jgi:hypothetical protein
MTRSGELHVTKECPEYKGQAGDFCTIASSNIDEITAGAKVVYASAVADGRLDSDIKLDCGGGNAADGHVVLDLSAGTGRITFSGGTGSLAGFTGGVDVTADAAGLWHWNGTYTFEPVGTAVGS